MSMSFIHPLPTPDEARELFPVSRAMAENIQRRRAEITDVFKGENDRLVLVIGPCSADIEDSVLRYMEQLAEVQRDVESEILIVPRVYTSKPRTTGKGYKGIMHQPDLSSAPDLCAGVVAARKMHFQVVSHTGLVCADELLYPSSYSYLDDLLGYVAIGARSTENQEHRLVASGIDVPVGMKNPTSGDLTVMMNGITAGQATHDFMYRGWSCRSTGNPLCHAILRGFTDESGTGFSNYHYESIVRVKELYGERPDLANPALVVDCNHSNSHKNPLEQPRIAREVLKCRLSDSSMKAFVKGLMIESYLEDGRREIGGGAYGRSITDPCLGWEKTRRLIYGIADLL
ncbi:3-deoxy-7-phosphoheptulonate synthase [Adlercreutzia muris]|jgi:3-deoxy-7-phosphoheptulonate synthase|uniref:3-deoxy-7-phosphoheptulonate synthase n=1 Tax=Adlercreutzia muris TaxID=1796610 RepID=UPI0021D5EAFA|nr:3-deoxy-7-phosphoheptulonate synthase [Adlercreutzia muris]MCU7584831.1 3-deoxy-7-phosphoheptulonate synthase [Adlercreutzia muris]